MKLSFLFYILKSTKYSYVIVCSKNLSLIFSETHTTMSDVYRIENEYCHVHFNILIRRLAKRGRQIP